LMVNYDQSGRDGRDNKWNRQELFKGHFHLDLLVQKLICCFSVTLGIKRPREHSATAYIRFGTDFRIFSKHCFHFVGKGFCLISFNRRALNDFAGKSVLAVALVQTNQTVTTPPFQQKTT
jgi:hypothetical protein